MNVVLFRKWKLNENFVYTQNTYSLSENCFSEGRLSVFVMDGSFFTGRNYHSYHVNLNECIGWCFFIWSYFQVHQLLVLSVYPAPRLCPPAWPLCPTTQQLLRANSCNSLMPKNRFDVMPTDLLLLSLTSTLDC